MNRRSGFDEEQVRELAARALACAVKHNRPAAGDAVIALNQLGGDALGYAMCAWADTFTARVPGYRPGKRVALSMFCFSGGGEHAPAHFSPLEQWAARFIAARAACDLDMTQALLATAATDTPAQVFTLLETCARNIEALDAGRHPVQAGLS